MGQFGWPALIKTAIFSVVATSGVWLVAGMAYYENEWARPATFEAYNEGQARTADYLPAPSANLVPPNQISNAVTGAAAPVPGASARPIVSPSPVLGNVLIPVTGVKPGALFDTFSDSRLDGRVHDAIDIAAPRGTVVAAAAAGTVERLFTSKLGGITVYIRSPDRRVIYYYAHLDSYAPGLAEGQSLAAGAPIGFVGSTGNADPAVPHLHFAISITTTGARWNDPATAVNPYPLLVKAR